MLGGKDVQAFVWPVRVYYEDTDAGGVVYYANYLKYMERARTEWLRAHGYEQDALVKEQDLVFAVRSLSIEYLGPARLDDLLQVGVSISELRRASIVFEQTISCVRNGQSELALTIAQVRVVSLAAASFKPKPIPPTLRKDLEHAG